MVNEVLNELEIILWSINKPPTPPKKTQQKTPTLTAQNQAQLGGRGN